MRRGRLRQAVIKSQIHVVIALDSFLGVSGKDDATWLGLYMHLSARLKASDGAVAIAHHDVAVLDHGHNRLAASAGAEGTLGWSESQLGVGSGTDGGPELRLMQGDPDLFRLDVGLLGVVASVVDNVVQGLILICLGKIKQLLAGLALPFNYDRIGLGLIGGFRSFDQFGGHVVCGFRIKDSDSFCLFLARHLPDWAELVNDKLFWSLLQGLGQNSKHESRSLSLVKSRYRDPSSSITLLRYVELHSATGDDIRVVLVADTRKGISDCS